MKNKTPISINTKDMTKIIINLLPSGNFRIKSMPCGTVEIVKNKTSTLYKVEN